MGFVICIEPKEKYAIHQPVFGHSKNGKSKRQKIDKWVRAVNRYISK